MDYKKGDRIKHPTKDGWGLGEVLEDSNAESVRAFFVGIGEKVLSLRYVQPLIVTGDEAAHPVLDNLKISKSAVGIKYQSLPQSIQYFLERFPEGFYGERFREHEREYKDKAHVLAQDLLGNEPFDSLLASENYAEISKRALKVVNATNLIFPNEKMSLKDGLADPQAQRQFGIALHTLLYGDVLLEQRFVGFALCFLSE